MRLVASTRFIKQFKKRVRADPRLEPKIREVLRLLAENPFNPKLETHKLGGKHKDKWGCTVEYDCRIGFQFVPNPNTGEEDIWLLGVGSHDQIYE